MQVDSTAGGRCASLHSALTLGSQNGSRRSLAAGDRLDRQTSGTRNCSKLQRDADGGWITAQADVNASTRTAREGLGRSRRMEFAARCYRQTASNGHQGQQPHRAACDDTQDHQHSVRILRIRTDARNPHDRDHPAFAGLHHCGLNNGGASSNPTRLAMIRSSPRATSLATALAMPTSTLA